MIKIPYGKSFQQLDIDEKRIAAILEPKVESAHKMGEEDQVRKALNNPIQSERLCNLTKGKKNILLITSDHTRPVPSKITLPIILKEIKKYNRNVNIKILIAAGCHRKTTHEEMVEKFGSDVIAENEFINHVSTDESMQVYKGILPSGGELWVNNLVDWSDMIVSEGFIEPHFFAGFSGGRKSILPGIASKQTVLANHCAEFIASPKAKTGNLVDNPIHDDMIYAMEKVGLDFILNVVIDKDKKIINAFAGHPKVAHERGCDFVKKKSGVNSVKSDIVITSNGGYPLDQNIYQAVKSMTTAASCVHKNGVIICVSACNDGHGGEEFYNYFKKANCAQDVVKEISDVARNETKADQWQAQILANIMSKYHIIMVAEADQKQNILDMIMGYASSINEALRQADEMIGKQGTVTIIPNGVDVIVNESC